MKQYKPVNIRYWNLRTLLDLQSFVSLPEHRSAFIAKDLQRYEISIVALRHDLLMMGSILSCLVATPFSGVVEGCKREAGVVVAVKTSFIARLEELPCGVSDRIMTMRLSLIKGCFVTLVCVCS